MAMDSQKAEVIPCYPAITSTTMILSLLLLCYLVLLCLSQVSLLLVSVTLCLQQIFKPRESFHLGS